MADFGSFKQSARDLAADALAVFDDIEIWLRAQMPRLETSHQSVLLLFGYTLLGLLLARLLRGGVRTIALLLVLLLMLHVLLPAVHL